METQSEIILECDNCLSHGQDGQGFSYRGDGVFSCSECGCMHTHVFEIVEIKVTRAKTVMQQE